MARTRDISRKMKNGFFLSVISGFILFIGWLAYNTTYQDLSKQYSVHLSDKSQLFKSYLKGELDKVQLVADMLSRHPVLQNTLQTSLQPTSLEQTNLFLQSTNDRLKTADIFIMDRSGLTVAASNFNKDTNFIGKNYAFRPYFTQALSKQKGQFLAIGVTSKKLGFYVSRAIMLNGQTLGIVVVKIDLDQLHHLTQDLKGDFALMDNKNILFFSSNDNYTLKSIGTISAKDRLEITRTRQYPITRIVPIDIKSSAGNILDAKTVNIFGHRYLSQNTYIQETDWSILMFSPLMKIERTSLTNSILVSAVGFIIFIAFYTMYKRRIDNERLQTIVENLPSGVTLFDEDLKLLICNDKLKELLEFPDTLFQDRHTKLEDLLRYNAERGEYGEGDPIELTKQAMHRTQLRKDHVFERTRPNGTVLEVRGKWLRNAFVTTYTDITERKKAEEEAKRNASYLQALLQNLDQGVTVIDEKLNIVYWNKAFFKLLDLPDSLMKPVMKYDDLIRYNAKRGEYGPGDIEQHVQTRVQASLKFEPHHFERTRPDGRTLEVTGKPLKINGQSFGFITTYVDITEHKRMASRLREMANTDVLTELYNRRYFTTLLTREIKRCERTGHALSVLLLDLDHFKSVNDRFGHNIGDLTLKSFAKTCKGELRDIDIMGRLGGEEFGIYLPETGRDGAFILAERIREAIGKMELHDENDTPFHITVSIGVCVYDSMFDERMEDLIKRADKALYRAKSQGRNRVC